MLDALASNIQAILYRLYKIRTQQQIKSITQENRHLSIELSHKNEQLQDKERECDGLMQDVNDIKLELQAQLKRLNDVTAYVTPKSIPNDKRSVLVLLKFNDANLYLMTCQAGHMKTCIEAAYAKYYRQYSLSAKMPQHVILSTWAYPANGIQYKMLVLKRLKEDGYGMYRYNLITLYPCTSSDMIVELINELLIDVNV
jgi:regulator of replication initiation timing